jgi:hypothetical protein
MILFWTVSFLISRGSTLWPMSYSKIVSSNLMNKISKKVILKTKLSAHFTCVYNTASYRFMYWKDFPRFGAFFRKYRCTYYSTIPAHWQLNILCLTRECDELWTNVIQEYVYSWTVRIYLREFVQTMNSIFHIKSTIRNNFCLGSLLC